MTTNIVEQLKDAPLFKGVAPGDLEALVHEMKKVEFPAGHVLFRKGDIGDAMYIILSGRVRIFTPDKRGHEITLAYHEPYRIFGDYALLDQQPRSASAAIEAPTTLLMLARESFMAFLPKHPTVGLAMIRNLADQVRHVTNFLSRVNDSMEQLAAGKYEQAIREIASSGTDDEMQRLVKAFIQMVHKVREREEDATPGP